MGTPVVGGTTLTMARTAAWWARPTACSILCLFAPSQEACGPQSPSPVRRGECLRAFELVLGQSSPSAAH